jgi:hypothetical protein
MGLAILFLPLLLVAVRGQEDWVAAILGLTWLPFITDINNYYWSVTLLFGLLAVRRQLVGIGFAALILVFSSIALVYPHSGVGIYMWGSLALVLFFTAVTISSALERRAKGPG